VTATRGPATDGVIAVLSPHIDDAALSVGAFMHRRARLGARVLAVTVLANDPALTHAQPGSWDRVCGFPTAGTAARVRREEDRRACARLGATPVWLPYGDHTYDRGGTDAQVWESVAAAIADADEVLVPGYPLTHPDHRWIANLVLSRRNELRGRMALYAEQPYAAGSIIRWRTAAPETQRIARIADAGRFLRRLLTGGDSLDSRLEAGDARLDGITWHIARASAGDRRAKATAIKSYSSQLRHVGIAPLVGARVYERVRGGETVAWL
jgi:LmbE family N-acetylglucosaminyl deacetylase